MKDKHKTREQLISELEISGTLRKQAQETLRENEEAERRFQKQLLTLLEVSNKLSKVNSFDDLCRHVVELGRSRLGFDRLGIWFVSDDPGVMAGSFGVDENGQLRDERGRQVTVDTDSIMGKILTHKMRSTLQVDTNLFNDRGEVVGRGSQAIAAVWDGEEVIGCISIDNLLLHQPITKRQCELLTLYASALGHICSRKQAEEALRKGKQLLQKTLDSLQDAVFILDAVTTKIMDCNPAASEIFGYNKDEMLGRTMLFLHADEAALEEFRKHLRRTIKGNGLLRHFENRMRRKDGTTLPAEHSVMPLEDGRGNRRGWVSVIRDISGRKRMEGELLKAHKLESAGTLAGGIAHDFNNLLTAILGNIALAKICTTAEDKVYQRLVEAEKASLRAKNLTEQLLTFSKGGAPVKKTVSIAELIKDSTIFSLSSSNVKFEFSVSGDLWPVTIDKGQIGQVINNLIINADQAMPEGGTVQVHCENVTIGENNDLPLKDGKYVKISIKDQGPGILREHLQKIFDPYFTNKQKGNGLGLAISYSIIKNHDGLITVRSELGKGATFLIYLPAFPREFLTKEREEQRLLVGKGKILVMDDERTIRDIAGEVLSYIGYEVEPARDGDEAIELYKKAKESGQPFDAVIMDLTIPGGMGGKEAIKKLLEIDPEVKAIVSSGYSHDPVMANFRKYGFSDIIPKPYEIEEISEILHKVINNGS